tara:strand:+ start:61 stop:384 length:324 start_codon:yes stop_codon:yes gene_type:complete
MTNLWRTPQELSQPLTKHNAFTYTTSTDTAENAAVTAGFMEEGIKLSFVVELFDLYIEFDNDATSSTLLIPANTGYYDVDIFIGTRISVINATAGSNGRIRGILWGR